MSFSEAVLLQVSGQHPAGTIGSALWRGEFGTSDSGYYVFQFAGNWTWSQALGPSYSSDATIFHPTWINCYGFTYFGDGPYIFNDPQYGWVLKSSLVPCLEYWVWNDPDDHDQGGHYQGENFWVIGSLPGEGDTISAQARGYQRGDEEGAFQGTDKDVTWAEWIRYEGSAQFGEYTNTADVEDIKIFGVPQWKDPNDIPFIRSVDMDGTGHYRYGELFYDASSGVQRYILGTYGSTDGWYETDIDPVPYADIILTFAYPPPAEGEEPPEGSDITLTWDSYVCGDETIQGYHANSGVYMREVTA